MATTTGSLRYEVVEGWEQLPDGFHHADVVGVDTDSRDRVFLITRQESRVLVYNRDGSFVASWGEGFFTPRTHGLTIAPDDTLWCVDEGQEAIFRFTAEGETAPDDRHRRRRLRHRLRRSLAGEHHPRRPPLQPANQHRRRAERRTLCQRWLRQRARPSLRRRRDADPVVGGAGHRAGAVQSRPRCRGDRRRQRADRGPRERPHPNLQPGRRIPHRVARCAATNEHRHRPRRRDLRRRTAAPPRRPVAAPRRDRRRAAGPGQRLRRIGQCAGALGRDGPLRAGQLRRPARHLRRTRTATSM